MDPVISLSLGRIAIGAMAVARPDAAAQAFRLDRSRNPQLPYMTRMFGSREIALGVITLAARGSARRRLALAGIAIDGSDAYAGFAAGQDGSVSKGTSVLLTAPAGMAMLAGVASVLGRGKRRRARRVATETA